MVSANMEKLFENIKDEPNKGRKIKRFIRRHKWEKETVIRNKSRIITKKNKDDHVCLGRKIIEKVLNEQKMGRQV